MRIDVPLLLRQLHAIEQAKAKWRRVLQGFDCLEVSYEDFVLEKAKVSRDLLDFLGVDHDVELVSPLKKILKSSKQEIVVNYSELAAAVKASGYGRFL